MFTAPGEPLILFGVDSSVEGESVLITPTDPASAVSAGRVVGMSARAKALYITLLSSV